MTKRLTSPWLLATLVLLASGWLGKAVHHRPEKETASETTAATVGKKSPPSGKCPPNTLDDSGICIPVAPDRVEVLGQKERSPAMSDDAGPSGAELIPPE